MKKRECYVEGCTAAGTVPFREPHAPHRKLAACGFHWAAMQWGTEWAKHCFPEWETPDGRNRYYDGGQR